MTFSKKWRVWVVAFIATACAQGGTDDPSLNPQPEPPVSDDNVGTDFSTPVGSGGAAAVTPPTTPGTTAPEIPAGNDSGAPGAGGAGPLTPGAAAGGAAAGGAGGSSAGGAQPDDLDAGISALEVPDGGL